MSARILVVDDVPANVKLLEAKLSREYYEVITAVDGFDAIEKAKQHMPDIILLDVMMPGIDGFETCRRIRAIDELSLIPIVMVTALSEKEDRIHGLEAGADDFLTKPINDQALFARVRSLVRLKVMMDELRLRGISAKDLGLGNKDVELGSLSEAKILVVDDDQIQSNQLLSKLSNVNKNVKLISNPTNIIADTHNADYDLIIVSTQMIVAEGLRICSQIRSQEETRHVSLLILIDEDDTEAMVRGMEIGVNDYIITPVDINELVARVKTQLRRKKYQDALRNNYQKSFSMAITDALTGLFNRRYMDTHLDNLLKEAVEFSKPFSLLMMDLDYFREVNNQLGHAVGDEVLKELGQRITKNIRPSDMGIRYGGEEFVILLPNTDIENAKVVGERIRSNIENIPFTVSTPEGFLKKTISIGLAGLDLKNYPADAVLKRADKALYEAKNSGRNKLLVAQ